MTLLRKLRLYDTMTVGREGEPPIVMQIRALSASSVRMVVIADSNMDINHARKGRLLTDEELAAEDGPEDDPPPDS